MNHTHKIIFTLALGSILIFSSIPTSESVLWDLLINVWLETNPIIINQNPVVVGTIVDHAGRPVSEVDVTIRVGTESVIVKTDSTGSFKHEFNEISVAGYYSVNVMAKDGDRMGLGKSSFQVKGPLSPSTYNEYSLDLFNSYFYKNIDTQQIETDPITARLYERYQEIQAEYEKQEQKRLDIEATQQNLQLQRDAADESAQAIIDEKNPGAGTYTGYKYDQFVSNLDPSVRDIIENQLNYTVLAFNDAQIAMDEVLENGGTLAEARAAYYEKASIPRNLMENLSSENYEEFNVQNATNATASTIKAVNSTSADPISNDLTVLEDGEYIEIDETGTHIELGQNVTSIILNINGNQIELKINGTEITQIPTSNSE